MLPPEYFKKCIQVGSRTGGVRLAGMTDRYALGVFESITKPLEEKSIILFGNN